MITREWMLKKIAELQEERCARTTAEEKCNAMWKRNRQLVRQVRILSIALMAFSTLLIIDGVLRLASR